MISTLIAYRQTTTGEEHLALVKGTWTKDDPVMVRVHSSCVTGDIFGSHRCDCGAQLHAAMELVELDGRGVVRYMQQEGRGIGLINKLKAYALQEQGLDTVEANLQLGFDMDARDCGVGAQAPARSRRTQMRLLTNNPKKRTGLIGYGLEIVENLPIEMPANAHNAHYLPDQEAEAGPRVEAPGRANEEGA